MRSLVWFLLAIGLVALVFIYLEQREISIASLSGFGLSSLTVQIVLLLIAGVTLLALFRENFSNALKSLAIWIAIVLALAVGYTYRFELREVGDRVMSEFVPGHVATRSGTGRVVEVAAGELGVEQHIEPTPRERRAGGDRLVGYGAS